MTDLSDGVYFGLPMDVYIAQPRLGAHGLGNLLVSPATFWASSYLNPTPRPVSAAVEATRTIGSAYHCARLEPEHFSARYAREPDKADYAKDSFLPLLANGTEIGEALATAGLPKKKAGETVLEQARRLEAVGYGHGGTIWPIVMAEWEAERGERIALSAQTWGEIVTDGERLRQSPDVAALLDGGAAEVSILWTDERGIRCKCRPDKLKADMWLDLKTFSNTNGKHVEQAIADAIRYNRYHVGAAHYRDGIAAVRAGLAVVGDATDAERELIAKLQLAEDFPACWYVFQEKAGIPNILAKRMCFHEVPISTVMNHAITDDAVIIRHVELATCTPSLWWERARREIKQAKRLFRTYSEVYAPGEPWLPFAPLGDITDASFTPYFLDEEVGE